MRALRSLLPVVLVALAFPLALPAHATFPGSNGFIAYQSGGFGGPGACPDIHIIDPAAGSSSDQSLTNCPSFVSDPSWSADGSKVVVHYLDNNSNDHIGTVVTSGGNGSITAVSISGASSPRDPSFNNDASVIAFGAGNAGGTDTANIFTVPASGGAATNITNASNTVNKEPEFSPDGTKLAWVTKNGPVYSVMVANADGTGATNVTASDNTHNNTFPSWSPDGTKIAFASDRGGSYQIYTMNADGSNVVQVTNESEPAIQPTWSPDGSRIAFTLGCSDDQCNNYGQNGNIYLIDLSGGAPPFSSVAIASASGPESDPDWGVPCPGGCSGGGTPPPPTLEKRAITLSLKGRLTAYGTLKDTGGQVPACIKGKPVKVQKKSGSSWKTLKTVKTGSTGKYTATIPNKPGTYRAYAPKVSTTSGDCAAATSKPRTSSP